MLGQIDRWKGQKLVLYPEFTPHHTTPHSPRPSVVVRANRGRDQCSVQSRAAQAALGRDEGCPNATFRTSDCGTGPLDARAADLLRQRPLVACRARATRGDNVVPAALRWALRGRAYSSKVRSSDLWCDRADIASVADAALWDRVASARRAESRAGDRRARSRVVGRDGRLLDRAFVARVAGARVVNAVASAVARARHGRAGPGVVRRARAGLD